MASVAVARTLGSLCRGLGAAFEGIGVAVQGGLAYRETVTKQKPLVALAAKTPKIGEECFIAPNAVLIGDVEIGDRTSIFYGSVIRGDVNHVRIGKMTSIQENVVIHVARNNPKGEKLPTVVGDNVIIGQNCTLHACTVGSNSLVGMGSTVLDNAKVEPGAIVAGGSMVTPNTTVPSGQIWAGSPARFLRDVTAEEASFLEKAAENMHAVAIPHAVENAKTFEEVLADEDARDEQMRTDPDFYDHMGIVPPEGVQSTLGPDGRIRVDDGSDPRLG
uniref:Gamma carbonic anhydrase mitochondrial-like n=1 Tax=Tetraselmis sp. GSL018 TaxID=582737 RepID=A0A061QSA1_9CHLO|mmetsp:Transcript_26017/g.61897  ORF Transcript_26017/g.61897 Transcript_26017/m.61897 type:complete len:275 (+) Transcript_26017:110-934(+)|eukprot:CAMPEP_0177611290 /NCGR_PEP_ID=MMETSP0419_2-20121207/20401_1 /TAXON_ID=582737 /ORGANISM="Tetraselmis sp., Strain GSL018" /LENGTH=274 /DNA_ID=CAMNT_0019106987 /DNA_START=56 /DNA_END=880 /DNA_ORIENTATION=+